MFCNGSRIIFKIRINQVYFIRAGIHQCSTLENLILPEYINGKETDIGANIHPFADDTSLYEILDNPLLAAEALNADLEHCW